MYDYGYNYSYDYGSTSATAGGILAGFGFMYIIMLAVSVFSIISTWKLFKKAGKKGWASIVPIYNTIVLIEIAELPMWYIALFFVPIANIYAMFKIYIEIAHKFGKSTGFGVGMVFLNVIFIPMLAFGKAEYKGGNGVPANNNVNSGSQRNMQNNMQSNVQDNMQYNNFQSNVMDVNSGVYSQPMFDVNMQNSSNAFQPIGNVSNNVQNMNANGGVQSMNVGNDVQSFTSVNPNQVMGTSNEVEVAESNLNNNPVQFASAQVNDVNNFGQMGNTQTFGVNQVPNNGVNGFDTSNMEVNNVPVQSNNFQESGMGNIPSQPINAFQDGGVNNLGQMNSLNNVGIVQNSTNMNMMNQKKTCPNCGNQVEFSAMFCNNCGHNL